MDNTNNGQKLFGFKNITGKRWHKQFAGNHFLRKETFSLIAKFFYIIGWTLNHLESRFFWHKFETGKRGKVWIYNCLRNGTLLKISIFKVIFLFFNLLHLFNNPMILALQIYSWTLSFNQSCSWRKNFLWMLIWKQKKLQSKNWTLDIKLIKNDEMKNSFNFFSHLKVFSRLSNQNLADIFLIFCYLYPNCW